MPFIPESEIRRRLARHVAWYRHELRDGPLLLMSGPPSPEVAARYKARHQAPVGDPAAMLAWWTDPKIVVERGADYVAGRTWMADSMPGLYINLGPGALAAFMGCRSVAQASTVWQEPLIEDWATAPELKLREESFWWQACQKLTEAHVAASQGRWVTGLTDIGGAADITSYFRTPEKLCFDLLDHPDEVKRSEQAVIKAWWQVYDRLYPVIEAYWGGSSGWHGTFDDGPTYPMQCDFSCMISVAMFREFVLPVLHEQARGLKSAVYHLDGPDAIRHLEAICEVPQIHAIQWTPGAGKSDRVADWLDLYRRTLKLDRSLHIIVEEPDLELVFTKLDPDRCALWTWGPTQADCDRIALTVDRLRRGRRRPI